MPDPIVITPAKKVHSLFDARTGYFVLSKPCGHFDAHPFGEGDSEKFVIVEHKDGELPEQYTDWDAEGMRQKITKIDLRITRTKRRLNRTLDNVISMASAVFVPGDDADHRQLVKSYDTRQNAIRHVGTGYAFATIQGAINASASGDAVIVHETAGNAYNENIGDNGLEAIQLESAVESIDGITPAIRIWAAAGNVIGVATQDCWHIENFEVDGVGTAAQGVLISNGNNCSVSRVVVHSVTAAGFNLTCASGTTQTSLLNCIAYDCAWGFYFATGPYYIVEHCTAVDNTNSGFGAGGANRVACRACLASDNGADFANAFPASCAWNVSSDLTAPGSGSETGFTNNNFVNYAGNDFRLNYPQNATGANIDGWALAGEDYLLNPRSRTTLIFYTGAHDPYREPTPGAPYCCGAIDAAPAAQGCILIRFCEMDCDDGTVPYRYDFHVKHVDLGPLTCAEINAGTWYARSCYNDEVNFAPGSPEIGSPGPNAAILQALIAFEAWNQHGDNIHLFTNREYQIAVRAVAIDATDTIYEDDNCEVVISWSSGYQGIQWEHILSWPCTYFCDGEQLDVGLGDAVAVNVGALPKVELEPVDIRRVPNLDVGLRSGVNFKDAMAEFGRQIDEKLDALTSALQQRRQ